MGTGIAVSPAEARDIPFFEAFSDPDLERILARSRLVSFAAGEPLVKRGDRGCTLYVIASGKAQVDVGGRYHNLTRGDLVGEMSALSSKPRMATVSAVDDLDAVEIDCGSEPDAFLMENPAVAVRVLKVLSGRLREVEDRLDTWMGVHRS